MLLSSRERAQTQKAKIAANSLPSGSGDVEAQGLFYRTIAPLPLQHPISTTSMVAVASKSKFQDQTSALGILESSETDNGMGVVMHSSLPSQRASQDVWTRGISLVLLGKGVKGEQATWR